MNKEKDILNKRGYLKRDFQFFHLKDKRNINFQFHYHDFNKIIIFISGNVTYLIEGKAYRLRPWDILLVSSDEVHKPLIDPSEVYERIVIWINPSFLIKHSNSECNLLKCFEMAESEKFNLMRLNYEAINSVKRTLSELGEACNSDEFGSNILKNALLMQIVVYLNRLFSNGQINRELNDIEYDENIGEVLEYINKNLGEDLSLDNIAASFFMSKYHLMHKFKKQTGYTIHNYIVQKRLMMASSFIKKGIPVTEVYIECGFGDYSNFIRAFKKMFGMSPKQYYKAVINQKDQYLHK